VGAFDVTLEGVAEAPVKYHPFWTVTLTLAIIWSADIDRWAV
jgi:hypothetical protein